MDEAPSALNDIRDKLGALTYAHALWRMHFFKATGYTPPRNSIFGAEMDALFASKQYKNNNNKEKKLTHSILQHTADKVKGEASEDGVSSNEEVNSNDRSNGFDGQKWSHEQEEEIEEEIQRDQGGNRGRFDDGDSVSGKRRRGKGKRPRGKVLRKRKRSDFFVERDEENEEL